MATTKTFDNVRLQLKYDSISNWTKNNPVLMAGEVAVTSVPAAEGDVKQAPSVLMKVGDGVTAYNDLKFVSGLAANVHNWALAENKPAYTAAEISGLDAYIGDKVENTNTTYQLVKVDDYNYKLQYKEIGAESWTDVAGGAIVIPKYDDTQVKADIEALQTKVGDKTVATQISEAIAALNLATTYEAKGAAAAAKTEIIGTDEDTTASITIKGVKKYADSLNTAMDTRVDALEAAVGEGGSVEAQITTAIGKLDKADEAVAGKYVSAVSETDGVITVTRENLPDYTDTYAAKTHNHTIAEVTGLQDAIDAKADETDVTALDGKVTTLIGTDTGKSVRTIASEELAAQMVPEDAKESLDTIQEIAAWIQSHPDDASAMNAKITALESKAHEHTNKDLLDTYTQTEANLADAVAKKHEHTNATVLDGITAEKVTNWDAAKTGVDTLNTKVGTVEEGKTLVQMIADAQDAASYDDTAIKASIKTNADDIDALETRATALETNAVLTGDTLIIKCGNSVIA